MYIHDHGVNTLGSQRVLCLCLLDLSATVDTIDHDILITRLSSWFGIRDSVLSSFKSSRCFRVRCETDLAVFLAHILPRCPQGSRPVVLYSSSAQRIGETDGEVAATLRKKTRNNAARHQLIQQVTGTDEVPWRVCSCCSCMIRCTACTDSLDLARTVPCQHADSCRQHSRPARQTNAHRI